MEFDKELARISKGKQREMIHTKRGQRVLMREKAFIYELGQIAGIGCDNRIRQRCTGSEADRVWNKFASRGSL